MGCPKAWYFTVTFYSSHDILTEYTGTMYVYKIYCVEQVKLQTKWSDRLEKKPTNLAENLKEIS
jgi:hypothetical protein